MGKHYKMTDGGNDITVHEDKIDFFKAKGYRLDGEANLATGQLVGHIRVRPPVKPTPPGHVPRMVEVTDGEQTIRVDANHSEQYSVYVRKGFLELPPMPPMPQLSEDDSPEQRNRELDRYEIIAEPVRALRETIKARALALEDGRDEQ